jgi:hypothetical protein
MALCNVLLSHTLVALMLMVVPLCGQQNETPQTTVQYDKTVMRLLSASGVPSFEN